MNIRRSRREDPIQALWKTCFGEDGAVFFRHDYRQNCSLVAAEEEGPPVAMLHYTARTLQLDRQTTVPAAYVLGIGTLPEFRRQGIAGELIRRLFTELRRSRIPMAFLLPAAPPLSDFYSKLGFRPMGVKPKLPRLSPVLGAAKKPEYQTLNALYRGLCTQYPFIIRDNEHWDMMAELYSLRVGADRYQIWDEGTLLEDSACTAMMPDPTGAHVKIIDWDYFLLLAEQTKRELPSRDVRDPFAPWNGRCGVLSPEECFFGDAYIYANGLYN